MSCLCCNQYQPVLMFTFLSQFAATLPPTVTVFPHLLFSPQSPAALWALAAGQWQRVLASTQHQQLKLQICCYFNLSGIPKMTKEQLQNEPDISPLYKTPSAVPCCYQPSCHSCWDGASIYTPGHNPVLICVHMSLIEINALQLQ